MASRCYHRAAMVVREFSGQGQSRVRPRLGQPVQSLCSWANPTSENCPRVTANKRDLVSEERIGTQRDANLSRSVYIDGVREADAAFDRRQIDFLVQRREDPKRGYDSADEGRAKPIVHNTAQVHPGARIGSGVVIGPFCIVGEGVKIGDNTRLRSNVVVTGETDVGRDCDIFHFATVGEQPQDKKYRPGETSLLKIGDRCQIRENVTINSGTLLGGGLTSLGSDCLILAGVHVGHDCLVEDNVVISNNVCLAGHVQIGEGAIIGGQAGIQQFVRIGRMAMIGGKTGVVADVIPFGLAVDNRARLLGLNLRGLRRAQVERYKIKELLRTYRYLFFGPTEGRCSSGFAPPLELPSHETLEERANEVFFGWNKNADSSLPATLTASAAATASRDRDLSYSNEERDRAQAGRQRDGGPHSNELVMELVSCIVKTRHKYSTDLT